MKNILTTQAVRESARRAGLQSGWALSLATGINSCTAIRIMKSRGGAAVCSEQTLHKLTVFFGGLENPKSRSNGIRRSTIKKVLLELAQRPPDGNAAVMDLALKLLAQKPIKGW